jgi:glycylpeptide N-tetradecanoyltransferase
MSKDDKGDRGDRGDGFWASQPVMQHNNKVNGPIETRALEDISPTPYNLPKGFEWVTLNVRDDKVLDIIHKFLIDNYVRDGDGTFALHYSKEFLLWAFTSPGYSDDLHLGVRVTGKQKLMGFIACIPLNLRLYDTVVKNAEINFLCVHKKLRNKRLAPVMIREIIRRGNLQNIWQGVYTSNNTFYRCVAKTRYYHRIIDVKNCVDLGFTSPPERSSLAKYIQGNKLPMETLHKIRPLTEKDVPGGMEILSKYLSKMDVCQQFDEKDFAHWFLPRDNVIYSYIVDEKDLISWYCIPNRNVKLGEDIKTGYLFYITSGELITDTLVLAKSLGFHVFNALDVGGHDSWLLRNKFVEGTGVLNYHLYNWQCVKVQNEKFCLILL